MSGNTSNGFVRTIDLSRARSGFVEGPVPVTDAARVTARLAPFGAGSADGAAVTLIAGSGPVESFAREAGRALDTAASASFTAAGGLVEPVTIDDADVDGRGWLDADVTAAGGDGARCLVSITTIPQG